MTGTWKSPPPPKAKGIDICKRKREVERVLFIIPGSESHSSSSIQLTIVKWVKKNKESWGDAKILGEEGGNLETTKKRVGASGNNLPQV